MAINYLNSINLNQNELIKAQIENQPNNASAGTGVEGQLYYDTTLDVLKVWAGGSWVEVGGGVETLTTTDGTYIDLTPNSPTTGAVTVTADLSAADGTASAASRFLTKDNTWATVPQGDITALTEGTYINIDNPGGPIPTINHDLTTRTDSTTVETLTYGGTFTAYTDVTTNATGHVTDSEETTFTMPSAYTFDVTADSGTDQTISSGNTLDIAGGTNITTVVGNTDTVTVNLDDSITLAGELTVSGTGQSSFAGQVTIPQVPSVDTDAASKHYVDQAVTGALSYQGGYNASTNTPDLTTSPNSIKKGFTYTVTASGTFFGENLEVGDVLIAEIDNPTDLNAWTTVQNNVDLADLTTVGIGNVNAGDAIDVSYTSGTATVSVEDSTASNKGAVIVAAGTGVSVAYSNGTATVTNTQTNSANTYAVTITDTATITHGLGTKDVIIQLYDVTTDETVYADVDRASTTTATITFATTPTNSVRVLVQKIG